MRLGRLDCHQRLDVMGCNAVTAALLGYPVSARTFCDKPIVSCIARMVAAKLDPSAQGGHQRDQAFRSPDRGSDEPPDRLGQNRQPKVAKANSHQSSRGGTFCSSR